MLLKNVKSRVLTKGEKKGNLILGPTARDLHVPSHMNESREDVQRFILAKCRKLVDAFDPSKFFFFFFFFFSTIAEEVIHSFSGIRAKSDRNDWIIERSGVEPNFINVAGNFCSRCFVSIVILLCVFGRH